MKKILPYIALSLALAEVVLMLLSWLLSAAQPASGVRSMLSSEGLRWLMGQYSMMLSMTLLSCLLLAVIAIGCFLRCGITKIFQTSRVSYRSQRALLMGVAVLLACIGVMLLLTVTPHAILLSATGDLFPSPFSASLIPVFLFYILIIQLYESLRFVFG